MNGLNCLSFFAKTVICRYFNLSDRQLSMIRVIMEFHLFTLKGDGNSIIKIRLD